MFLCSILVPILWGLALLLLPELKNRKVLVALTGLGLVAAAACGLLTVFARPEALQLFSFGKNLSVFFRVDSDVILAAPYFRRIRYCRCCYQCLWFQSDGTYPSAS